MKKQEEQALCQYCKYRKDNKCTKTDRFVARKKLCDIEGFRKK